jgi:hypothetical protein
MKHSQSLSPLGICVLSAYLGLAGWMLGGCNTGSPEPGTSVPNINESAAFLPEYDAVGNYIPYYGTADLNTPRYLQGAITHSEGFVYVFGGSDERGLSSLDTVEIYDQSTRDQDEEPSESITGIWIDTDFEGNPIVLPSGSRLLFTVNEMSNGKLLLVGGSRNIRGAVLYDKPEIFDPETRTFEAFEDDRSSMIDPRFRHTTVLLQTGGFLVVGGQLRTTATVINEQIPEGFPGRETQITVFPSTPRAELFSPNDLSFATFTERDSDDPSILKTPRGRSDHAMTRLAGFDRFLGTADDIWLIAGGYQTLSAESGLAPRIKDPGLLNRGEGDGLTSVEVLDLSTQTFSLLASIRLNTIRVNTAQVVNLGEFNDFTPDGVLGMGNSILISHGNVDAGCPTTPIVDQVFVASFLRGSGPADGIRFFEVTDDATGVIASYTQNVEYFSPPFSAFVDMSDRLGRIGRAATNMVALPRRVDSVPGVRNRATWAFSLAGVDIYPVPGGCVYNGAPGFPGPSVHAGCVFDPFYNLESAFLKGLSPRDLVDARRSQPQNFLGIVGCWFTLDGLINDDVLDSFGTTPIPNWAKNRGQRRVFHRCVPVAGVDGTLGTFDDRILLVGGGNSYPENGGEPTSPTAEVFLPPGVSIEGR